MRRIAALLIAGLSTAGVHAGEGVAEGRVDHELISRD